MEDKKLLQLLEKAIRIAVNAHANQFDKAGAPYILHPIRVMNGVKKVLEKIVGVLHDVVEDTNITIEDLEKEGCPSEALEAIDALTRRIGESYTDFILRIKENEIARKIKIVDLRDNSDLFRLHEIEEKHLSLIKRYHAAMKELRKDGQVYITK